MRKCLLTLVAVFVFSLSQSATAIVVDVDIDNSQIVGALLTAPFPAPVLWTLADGLTLEARFTEMEHITGSESFSITTFLDPIFPELNAPAPVGGMTIVGTTLYLDQHHNTVGSAALIPTWNEGELLPTQVVTSAVAGNTMFHGLRFVFPEAPGTDGLTTEFTGILVNSLSLEVAPWAAPEPATPALLGLALAGMGFARRRLH